MFKQKFAALITALAMFQAPPVLADEVIAEYFAWLDARDTVSSKGVRLDSFGAVLAQDRANFHRFGIRQSMDGNDPIFSSREMRARLPQFYSAGRPVEAYILDDVMSGRGHFVFVRVIGRNGLITHVNVHEGAG